MTKKELAKLFFNSFRTEIIGIEKPIDMGGADIEFRNHSGYEKREFTSDFNRFAKAVAKELGTEVKSIKGTSKYSHKNLYYIWDPKQTIFAYGVEFELNRRRMNQPHSIQDGCSQRYYVWVSDKELVDEILVLNEERVDKERQEKEERWPSEVEKAKEQCREMISELQDLADGKVILNEEAVSRINEAYFQICVMSNPQW